MKQNVTRKNPIFNKHYQNPLPPVNRSLSEFKNFSGYGSSLRGAELIDLKNQRTDILNEVSIQKIGSIQNLSVTGPIEERYLSEVVTSLASADVWDK